MTEAIKIYFHKFWGGFEDNTDPTGFNIFQSLFQKVYRTENVSIATLEEANVLVESPWIENTLVNYKKWLHTYIFSGESYLNQDRKNYDCILYGEHTHENVVNVPLYVPYICSSHGENFIKDNKSIQVDQVPPNDVVVIITNPYGKVRNAFLDRLEQKMKVVYAGRYRNNIGGYIAKNYNTPEFQNFVSQFKFIITMENNQHDTYITEKVTHGFFGKNLSVYWGSKNVGDYINLDRIVYLEDESKIDEIIEQMRTMTDQEWLRKVNTKPFTELGSTYSIDAIASEIRKCIRLE